MMYKSLCVTTIGLKILPETERFTCQCVIKAHLHIHKGAQGHKGR